LRGGSVETHFFHDIDCVSARFVKIEETRQNGKIMKTVTRNLLKKTLFCIAGIR